MSRRDLLYSIFGHFLFGFTLVFVAPVSSGLWGNDRPLPLIFPVGIVATPPENPATLRSRPADIKVPEPAADDLPALEPLEKLEKEKLAEKPAQDSTQTAQEKESAEDTLETLAQADTDTLDRTGEMSHTIVDGVQTEGEDDIFGEYVPAVGYGATDPYFQSLFLAIQRSFRNPVPGYKPVRCVITFTVLNTGEIENIRVETSSGIPRFDRAAVRALERIVWGRPFPAKFADYDGYYITMPFEYVPQ